MLQRRCINRRLSLGQSLFLLIFGIIIYEVNSLTSPLVSTKAVSTIGGYGFHSSSASTGVHISSSNQYKHALRSKHGVAKLTTSAKDDEGMVRMK